MAGKRLRRSCRIPERRRSGKRSFRERKTAARRAAVVDSIARHRVRNCTSERPCCRKCFLGALEEDDKRLLKLGEYLWHKNEQDKQEERGTGGFEDSHRNDS